MFTTFILSPAHIFVSIEQPSSRVEFITFRPTCSPEMALSLSRLQYMFILEAYDTMQCEVVTARVVARARSGTSSDTSIDAPIIDTTLPFHPRNAANSRQLAFRALLVLYFS